MTAARKALKLRTSVIFLSKLDGMLALLAGVDTLHTGFTV
jgi:hypothetical protein